LSDFDTNWLALREPSDHKARSAALVARLGRYLEDCSAEPNLLDIGCGIGSTYRALSRCVPAGARWRLLDHDPRLLSQAKRDIADPEGRVTFHHHDLNDLEGLPLDGVAVVTASAFFDLCSQDLCDGLANRLAGAGVGLYAALSYDGVMRWTRPHPLDAQVTSDFNRHQRSDKGLGSALGPDATAHLSRAFARLGYHVETAPSQWMLGPADSDLQRELVAGMERPLREIGSLSISDIASWIGFRLDTVEEPDTSCKVGHLDLLALPR